MAPQPQIDAIGIAASDIAASVAFYRRLGLDFPDGEPEDHVEAAIGTTGVRVMLDSESMLREIDPTFQGSSRGRVHLAVLLQSPDEVNELYADLAADGFGHTEPYDAFWGQRYAHVLDPDGQGVDLYAQLPEVTQPES